MNDIEQLLRMTERPQDYTDEELQQLMNDPDMRAYYELMANAETGFALKKEEDHGDRPMIPCCALNLHTPHHYAALRTVMYARTAEGLWPTGHHLPSARTVAPLREHL